MEPIVTVVVLVSALIHAAWNAMVKGEEDALETQAAVVVGGAFFAVPFLFFVPFPNPEAGFYLVLSAAIHCAYFAALAVGYRVGDLSFVYPIARGTGPILVALLSAFLIGEILSVPQLASVSIICFGLFTLALSGRAGGGIRAFAFAILVSATIAGYSLTDGIGVRVAQNPWSYIPWLIFVQAFPLSHLCHLAPPGRFNGALPRTKPHISARRLFDRGLLRSCHVGLQPRTHRHRCGLARNRGCLRCRSGRSRLS